MAVTTNQALPYPVDADAPNGPSAFLALANAVERIGVMVFASAATRTTKLTAPTEGMLCWRQDGNLFERYDGSSWVEMPDLTHVNTLIATAATTAATATNALSALAMLKTGSTATGSMNFVGVGFNSTAAIAKPTVTGARASNAALTSLLTALANYGLIVNSTST